MEFEIGREIFCTHRFVDEFPWAEGWERWIMFLTVDTLKQVFWPTVIDKDALVHIFAQYIEMNMNVKKMKILIRRIRALVGKFELKTTVANGKNYLYLKYRDHLTIAARISFQKCQKYMAL